MEKLTKLNQNQNIHLKNNAQVASTTPAGIDKYLHKIFRLSDRGMRNIRRFFRKNEPEEDFLSVAKFGVDAERAAFWKHRLYNRHYYLEDQYQIHDLPFHIDDHDWLVQYTAASIHRLDPKANYTLAEIRHFVDTSPAFQQAMNNFENQLIKSKIMCTQTAEPSASDKKRYKKFGTVYYYEEVFRNQILYEMEMLGVDRNTTEIALEQNADLWREREMRHTFRDIFYPTEKQPVKGKAALAWFTLSQAHESEWVKYREYEYYRDHQAVINQAQAVTPNMKMTAEDLWKLLDTLNAYNTQSRAMLKQSQMVRESAPVHQSDERIK